MTRESATSFCRAELEKNGLSDWSIRLTQHTGVLGMCDHRSRSIILSTYHIDTHPESEVRTTIKHEVAHAIVGIGHQHDEVWESKARELGCESLAPCSHLSYPPEVIDAIRSGADVECTVEPIVVQKTSYKVTRIQDKCEVCGKVAKNLRETLVEGDEYDRKFIFLECGHLIVRKIPKGTAFGSLVSNHWREEVKSCHHEFDKNQCKLCGEYRMFPFQQDGARFIEAALCVNKGAAIFDEMGLGKTIQGLGYLHFHEEMTPAIFMVKSALKFQFFKEILRWCGPKFLPQIIQSSNDFLIPGLKCYIISYDMLVSKERKGKNGNTIKQGFDVARLIELQPKVVFLDECQQIKNPDASRTQEVRKLCKNTKVIPLSGTPWKNRGSEFFTVLNMLDPMKFWSYSHFIDQWVDTYWDGKYMKQGGIRRIEKFREFTKDILIRREICDVMKEMPDVNRTLFYVELDKIEQQTYDAEVSDFVKWYNDAEANNELNSFNSEGNILAKLARMRHITGLAKIPATVEFVRDHVESTNRKITVFVHHKDVGEILFRECQKLGFPTFKLTAEQDSMSRGQIVDEFDKANPCILIASTLASGEGINLQSCGDAIMHERQWNPQNEDQAAPGRFRRIGSTFTTVNVTFMTASDTVDDILAGIVEPKRAFFHAAMNKGEMPVFNQGSFAREIAEGIVKGFVNKKGK